MTARIVLLDIETAPNLGWVWGKYDQNVIAFHSTTYILSFAYKVLSEAAITVRALPDYKNYSKDMENDKLLVQDLWSVLDEADIIVAHNGDAFDIKRSNARFVVHGLPPPSPFKTIDTLKIAKKHFKFESNKLDDLGQYLGVGEKMSHTGWKLWRGCMEGDPKSWERMKEYNVQDIQLLEGAYLRLRPWATTHPNLNLYGTGVNSLQCPSCSSDRIQKRGFSYAITQVRQRLHCKACGAWFSGAVVKR